MDGLSGDRAYSSQGTDRSCDVPSRPARNPGQSDSHPYRGARTVLEHRRAAAVTELRRTERALERREFLIRQVRWIDEQLDEGADRPRHEGLLRRWDGLIRTALSAIAAVSLVLLVGGLAFRAW